jgi:replicative DNA helicase
VNNSVALEKANFLIRKPNDFNSEKMLVGQLIYSGSNGNRELDKAMAVIENLTLAADLEKHFYNVIHAKIYNLIYLNYCKQRPISASSLASALYTEPYFQNDIHATEVYLENLVLEAGFFSQL